MGPCCVPEGSSPFSSLKSCVNSRPVNVECLVGRLVLGQFFSPVLRFVPLSFISLLSHHFFTLTLSCLSPALYNTQQLALLLNNA